MKKFICSIFFFVFIFVSLFSKHNKTECSSTGKYSIFLSRRDWNDEEAFEIAKNLVNLGFPIETVVSATRLDPEKVKVLYQSNEQW